MSARVGQTERPAAALDAVCELDLPNDVSRVVTMNPGIISAPPWGQQEYGSAGGDSAVAILCCFPANSV